MNAAVWICRIMLIVVVALAFDLEDFQSGNAFGDGDNDGYSSDLPFSLPFDSDFADESNDDDYQLEDEVPFP
jgi:hypothetical protein